jgi:hypothetical protein
VTFKYQEKIMKSRFRFSIAIKHLILLAGVACLLYLISNLKNSQLNLTGIGIAAAGCFIAFALIENNDVRESNKE